MAEDGSPRPSTSMIGFLSDLLCLSEAGIQLNWDKADSVKQLTERSRLSDACLGPLACKDKKLYNFYKYFLGELGKRKQVEQMEAEAGRQRAAQTPGFFGRLLGRKPPSLGPESDGRTSPTHTVP